MPSTTYDEQRATRQKGAYALFVVLIAILLLLASGALLAGHLVRRMTLLQDQSRDLHVQSLLDSGLALSLAQIRDDFAYEGEQGIELDGGEVRFAIAKIDQRQRQVDLRSSYRGERRRAVVKVYIERPGALPEVRGWDVVPTPIQAESPGHEAPDHEL